MILIVARAQLNVFVHVVIVVVVGKCAVRRAHGQRCCQHQTKCMFTHVCFLLSWCNGCGQRRSPRHRYPATLVDSV